VNSKEIKSNNYVNILLLLVSLCYIFKLGKILDQNFYIADIVIIIFGLKNFFTNKLLKTSLDFINIILIVSITLIISLHLVIGEDYKFTIENSGQLLFCYGFMHFVVKKFSDFTFFCKLNAGISVIYVISILFHQILGIESIKIVNNERIHHEFTGINIIFPIGFIVISNYFKKKFCDYRTTNLKTNHLLFASIVITFIYVSLIIGQRGLFITITIIAMLAYYRIYYKRFAGFSIVYLFIYLSVIAVTMYLDNLIAISQSYRSLNMYDEHRLNLVKMFILFISDNILYLFIGTVNFNWADSVTLQEPHNFILHLTSDYGIFVSVTIIIYMYGRVRYKKIMDLDLGINMYSTLMIALIPYFMFHTYTFNRATILPLFYVIVKEGYNIRIKNRNTSVRFKTPVNRAHY
jgi:hypothetical protein